MSTVVQHPSTHNDPHWDLRVDLAAAFRWSVRERWHEAVSNHYSAVTNDAGTEFLMNRNQVHFSRITASSLLHLDANDPDGLVTQVEVFVDGLQVSVVKQKDMLAGAPVEN